MNKIKIMASGPTTSWQIDREKVEAVTDFVFLGPKITEDTDSSHELKDTCCLRVKAMTNLNSILKSRDITADKGRYGQDYGFSSSHVWMWELDHKESWMPKNRCFRIMVLGKTL